MKHVWILNHYAHRPKDKGGLTRHHSLGRHLPAWDWRASIIAAGTEHPSGRPRIDIPATGLETIDDVQFLWIDTPGYWGNGFDRMRNMASFAWRAATPSATAELDEPDAIIGSTPHPGAALAGARLARHFEVPFVFEVRDPWPQALIEMGRVGAKSPTAHFMRRIERWLYESSDRAITLWPNMGAYLHEQGINVRPPVWISNGIDLTALPPPQPLPEKQSFTLMYLGAHGGANGLDTVVRAMGLVGEKAVNRKIILRLIGDGPSKPALRGLASAIGANNVFFEDPVERSNVPVIAAEADAFIFNLIDAPMFRFGISPNKLFEYMAARRPILFCCQAFNDPVADAGCGISVRPADPEKLAAAILELAALPRDKRARMAVAGRRYVEAHFSFEKLAQDLAQLLDECLARC